MKIPQQIDAEAGVLGAMMSDPGAVNVGLSKLKPDDFYKHDHQRIFKAIAQLNAENKSVDAVTVHGKLNGKVAASDLVLIQSQGCLINLLDTYIELVKNASIKRNLRDYTKLINHLIETETDVTAVLAQAESKFFDISKNQTANWEMNDAVILEQVKVIESRKGAGGVTGVPSGFLELDKLTTGWQPGQLIFVGAVPKMGKSSFALHATLNAAANRHPTLYFTLEMQPGEMADRQISSWGMVPGQRIRTGDVDDFWPRIADAAGKLSNLPIGWVYQNGLTVTEIKAISRRFQAENGLGLVIIDQLDKIFEKPLSGESKTYTIKRVTTKLKAMAQDLNVPVIVLTQLLDKSLSSRNSPRPKNGDIRDSSGADEDADVIIYLWRPAFYWPDKREFEDLAELIVSRQRAGPTGSVWVRWVPNYTALINLDRRYWPKEVTAGE